MDSLWAMLKQLEETFGLFPTAIAVITLLVAAAAVAVGLISLWQARVGKKHLDVQAMPPASLPQPAPQPPPTHLWNVPFQRNPFFTGRVDVLEGIHSTFSKGGIAAISQAVAGMGGIGKTQTAVEYAYRYGNEYSAVFWTGAEKDEDVLSGFVRIATLFELPEAGCPDSRAAVGAVMQWLADHDRWLLVFDNADEPTLLEAYMNPAYQGHILITSRADRFDMLNIAAPARLEVLPPDDALAFLLKRAECKRPSETQIAAAKAVAERLGYFPLALEQAGAFVLSRHCSFADYLAEYGKKGVALFGEQGPVTGDYPNTVLTTWAVNFAQVEEKSPAAAELLRVAAFLAPEPIPYRLVMESAEHFGPAVQAALGDEPNNLSVSNLLAPLADYSLVEINPEAHTFTLHRLVQEAMRHGWSKDKERECADQAVRAVNATFSEVEVENWPWCEALLPHALACDGHIAGLGMATEEAGRLLNQAGCYAKQRARYALAESLFQRSLAIIEKVFGFEHSITALCLNNLGELYRVAGNLAKAEQLHQRSQTIRVKIFDPTHHEIGINFGNLGSVLRDLGKFVEAEQLLKNALEIHEKGLGPGDPHVAVDLDNLAGLYRATGHFAESEPLFQRALAIYEKRFGPKHLDTGTSLNNLAGLYQDMGRFAEAEPLFQRALAIREERLGPKHPDTGISLNNLAVLYEKMGRQNEAEPLYRRALGILEKVLGPEHKHVGITCGNLCNLLQKLNRKDAGRPLLERAVEIDTKVYGPDHPEVATDLSNLAGLYYATGRLAEAEPLYGRALTIREKVLGPEHPDTAQSLNNLAMLYKATGRLAEAESLHERALAIREKVLGPEHPSTAISLNNLAELYRATGRLAEAEPLFKRVVAIFEKVLGPEHPNTATSLNNLAGLYDATGRLAEAEPLYKRVVAIFEKVLGPEHPSTGVVCYNYGDMLQKLGRTDEARPLLERAAAVKARHPYVRYDVGDLGGGAPDSDPDDDPSPAPGS